MTDVKTILLIGRSGRGKSTLANVITNTNNFKESSGSISETKKVQVGEFEDTDNKINYAIIDTPGIGDTKMSDSEVLNIIAEAIYLAKDGIGQVFFVNDGRFDQYEMATYDLLRTILFDKDVTNHTTIVRTRFEKFRKEKECKEDIGLMIKEASEKRNEIERNISAKEKELVTLSSDSVKYQELSAEVEKAKKELTAINLAEIIESCQGRIVYVNNPSMDVVAADDEDENKREKREKLINLNKKTRIKSKEKLLKHLNKSCQGEPYNPPSLKKLSNEIADDYFQYLKKKEELDKEMKRLSSEASQTSNVFQASSNKVGNVNFPSSSQTELTAEEEKNIIIDKKEQDKIIAELQNKKERLQEEISEKEKIIHQKVLKHIFNNYEAINKELGGDIFLSSVAGDHPWIKIHSEFANKETVLKWLSQGFDYFQTQKWATALIGFNPQIDAEFCAWLRDIKKLTVEKIQRLSHPHNLEQLRWEYTQQLKGEVSILDKHNEQLEKKDWTDIHEDFGKEDFYYGYKKTYQQVWEGLNITYQEAKEWNEIGFTPYGYNDAKSWKDHGFILEQVKKWIDVGLTPGEYRFATYLKQNNYQPKEYENKSQELAKNAQEWLDYFYPKKERKEITELHIDKKSLQGSLKLEGFVKLKKFYFAENELTNLDLSDCVNLEWLRFIHNQLPSLNFLDTLKNPEKLTYLAVKYDKISSDLTLLKKFVNLEFLNVGGNKFYGSLELLKDMNKLKDIWIFDTDLDSGLEYLPESVKVFCCSIRERKDAKCKILYDLFADEKGELETDYWGRIKNFPQKLKEYKQRVQSQSQQQPQILQTINDKQLQKNPF